MTFADSNGSQPNFTTFLDEGSAGEANADVPLPPGQTHIETHIATTHVSQRVD